MDASQSIAAAYYAWSLAHPRRPGGGWAASEAAQRPGRTPERMHAKVVRWLTVKAVYYMMHTAACPLVGDEQTSATFVAWAAPLVSQVPRIVFGHADLYALHHQRLQSLEEELAAAETAAAEAKRVFQSLDRQRVDVIGRLNRVHRGHLTNDVVITPHLRHPDTTDGDEMDADAEEEEEEEEEEEGGGCDSCGGGRVSVVYSDGPSVCMRCAHTCDSCGRECASVLYPDGVGHRQCNGSSCGGDLQQSAVAAAAAASR